MICLEDKGGGAMNIADVKITDNSDLFKNAKDEAIQRALEAIGMQGEGYAKMLCPC